MEGGGRKERRKEERGKVGRGDGEERRGGGRKEWRGKEGGGGMGRGKEGGGGMEGGRRVGEGWRGEGGWRVFIWPGVSHVWLLLCRVSVLATTAQAELEKGDEGRTPSNSAVHAVGSRVGDHMK